MPSIFSPSQNWLKYSQISNSSALHGQIVGQISAEIPTYCSRRSREVYTILRKIINSTNMGGKYKIVMVRHGESEWNQKNQFCGWYDANLSEKGEVITSNTVHLP